MTRRRLAPSLRVISTGLAFVVFGCDEGAPFEASRSDAVTSASAGAAVAAVPVAAPRTPPHAPQWCANAEDVTFIFAADTHFGHDDDVDRLNLEQIREMNAVGGKPWPRALGGSVGYPCGVLVGGDLTENGQPWEWDRFTSAFGLTGTEGQLKLPVFEVHGNHDKHAGALVRKRVAERHGGEIYSFDWGRVHVVALGEAPDEKDRAWLRADLAKLKPGTGVVLYFHFPLEGPYSRGQWFGDADHRDGLMKVLEGVNVLGIFHGHYHATGIYRYRGHDVYRAGSPKHGWHTFTVAQISGGQMKVASWDYDTDRWRWWHEKPVLGGTGRTVKGRLDDVPRD